MSRGWAPYMEWAKKHPPARFDLAGSNLLPLDVSELPGAREALELGGPNDEGYGPLLEAIANRYGVSEDRVATAPGASGANFLATAALIRAGDEVLVEEPGYDPLPGAARLLGARVRTFRRRYEEGWALDPGRVEAALTPGSRLVVITDPHNPSGTVAHRDALADVGRLAERVGARVLVDEVYLDTLGPDRPPPAAELGPAFVSTSSLTKAYGLSGLRSGWALASPDVAEAMRRARDVVDAVSPFPSDVLATLAFRHLDALAERARHIVEPNRARVEAFVQSRPELEWVTPTAGTMGFPRLRGTADAEPFVHRLLRRHDTAVVPGRFFGELGHFRIAFGRTEGEVEGGLAALGRALDREPGVDP